MAGQRKHGQRGQCIKRGEKTYLLRAPLGCDPETGKRRYVNETFHGTQKKALKRLTKLLGDKDAGVCMEPEKITLNAYLDRWLDTMKTQVGPHTHADYTNIMRRYVRPTLGTRLLATITALDIDAVYIAMFTKGLTSRTMRYVHVTLKQAFTLAVKKKQLSWNPVNDATLPKQDATGTNPQVDLHVFTREQATQFLDAAKFDRLGTMFTLALITGMRPGEYFGLQWSDVDFDLGSIRVRQTLIPYGEDGWSFAPPKTEGSRRTIQLPADAVHALREHKRKQAEERLKAGPKWQQHDLVFCTPVGGPLHLRNVNIRHFKPILKAAGLPKTFTLYSLRHSSATLQLAEGVNVKVVSERLGHSNIQLTLQTYTHCIPTMQDKAVDMWDQFLAKG